MMSSSYDDSYPSRPATTAERKQRSASRRSCPDMCGREQQEEDAQRRSSRPQHEEDEHEITKRDPRAASSSKFFDLFYQLTFSLVHAALTAFLAPVLTAGRRKSSRSSSRSSQTKVHQYRRQGSYEADPELAMPELDSCSVSSGSGDGGRYPQHHAAQQQPILRSGPGPATPENAYSKKSVRFPAPERRARPPLGRIGSLQSSSSSSVGSSSSSSSSSGSGPSRRSNSRYPTSSPSPVSCGSSSGRGARAPSPFGRRGAAAGQRMAHSTYFLE